MPVLKLLLDAPAIQKFQTFTYASPGQSHCPYDVKTRVRTELSRSVNFESVVVKN